MRRATLIGYHGMQNFGDDLFLEIVCGQLREGLGVDEALVHAADDAAAHVPARLPWRAIHGRGRRLRRLDWIAQWRASLRSDVVVFAAGSILAGPQFRQPALLARALRLADRARGRHTPVLGLGLSLGPFPGDAARALTAEALRAFDALLLRDDGSVAEACRLGLGAARPSQDLVTAIAPDLIARRDRLHADATGRRAPLRIGFALGPGYHAWDAAAWQAWGAAWRARLQALATHTGPRGLAIRLFNTCASATDGDAGVVDALQAVLATGPWTIERQDYLVARRDAFLDALLACDGLVSSRLHPGLIGLGTGMPVLQLAATSPKVAGVYERIGLRPAALLRTPDIDDAEWQRFADGLAGRRAADTAMPNRAAFEAAGRACREDLAQALETARAAWTR